MHCGILVTVLEYNFDLMERINVGAYDYISVLVDSFTVSIAVIIDFLYQLIM